MLLKIEIVAFFDKSEVIEFYFSKILNINRKIYPVLHDIKL